MFSKKTNQRYVKKHMKPTRKEVLAPLGRTTIAILAAILVTEAALFYSDFEAFTILFGQVVGDATARPIAVALSLMVPVFTYLIVAKLAEKVSEQRYRKAVAGLLAGMIAVCLLCLIARFALEAQALSTDEGESWLVNGLLYSLPLLAAMLGSAAGALESNDPSTKKSVALAKLRFREIGLESELETLMANKPETLADQVKLCYAESQRDAAVSMQSHLAQAVLDCISDYRALEMPAVQWALSGGLCTSVFNEAPGQMGLGWNPDSLLQDGPAQLEPVATKTPHGRVVESWEDDVAAGGMSA